MILNNYKCSVLNDYNNIELFTQLYVKKQRPVFPRHFGKQKTAA